MGVSSYLIQLTEMKMIPSTFLLITLLCVLPPPPVACKKNMLKHIHKEIHQISDGLGCISCVASGGIAGIIATCVAGGGSPEHIVGCILDKAKEFYPQCLPRACYIVCLVQP